MKMLETIEVEPIDLVGQKIKEALNSKLILYDNALEYFIEFYADEPKTEDPELLKDESQWEEVYNNFHVTAAKCKITAVEMSYQTRSEVWMINIFLDAFSIKVYFDKEEKAEALRTRISEYLFGICEH